MAEVQAVPEDMKGLIPHITVNNGKEALEFYKKALGAEVLGAVTVPDGRVMHANMMIGGCLVFLNDDFPEMTDGSPATPDALGGTPVAIHQYVEDTDTAIAKAVDAGATVFMPAADMFWGDRYGQVKDPYGHIWSFATHIKDVSEEEMEAAIQEFGQGQPGQE